MIYSIASLIIYHLAPPAPPILLSGWCTLVIVSVIYKKGLLAIRNKYIPQLFNIMDLIKFDFCFTEWNAAWIFECLLSSYCFIYIMKKLFQLLHITESCFICNLISIPSFISLKKKERLFNSLYKWLWDQSNHLSISSTQTFSLECLLDDVN